MTVGPHAEDVPIYCASTILRALKSRLSGAVEVQALGSGTPESSRACQITACTPGTDQGSAARLSCTAALAAS